MKEKDDDDDNDDDDAVTDHDHWSISPGQSSIVNVTIVVCVTNDCLCFCSVQVSPEGLDSSESPDISPMSGTVEFLEGISTALLILTIVDDQVSRY